MHMTAGIEVDKIER